MEKMIANRPILLDGRLYKTGEELPESDLRDSWLKSGDASIEAPESKPEPKQGRKSAKEASDELQGDSGK